MNSKGFGYPVAREAQVSSQEAKEYKNVASDNPYLTGTTLTVLSHVVTSFQFVQRFFWQNAHFGTLRHLDVLKSYPACYHPLVVPPTNGVNPGNTSELFKTPPDTTFYSSADFVDVYNSKRTTPLAVAEHLLSLVKEAPHSVAFAELRPELTLAAAKASTERYANGNPLGPLDGVPIAVKDEVDIHGYTRTFGSAKTWDHGKGETAWSIQKLEEAGAVIIGKTNMHEFGTDTTNNNPVHGTPRNPYNKDYYTGGSSGGTAYAIGSGLVPIAVGADGGGSIRLPSSYCGIYGIKTSHGRISARPTPSLTTSNGVVGPMASSLADLALAYRVMSKPDPLEPSSAPFPKPLPLLSPISSPTRKRIGIYRPWFDDSSKVVSALCNQAIQHLITFSDYELIEMPTIPYLNESRMAHALTIITEMSTFINGDYKSLNAVNKILMSVASQTMAVDFSAANQVRALMMSHFAWIWEQYPGMILLTPTVPNPGRKIQERELAAGVSDTNSSLASMRYVFLANFIGTPALNVVVGYDDDSGSGIPVGLMGMGEWGTEEQLFGWGKDVTENFVKGSGRRKGETWVDVLGGVGAGRV